MTREDYNRIYRAVFTTANVGEVNEDIGKSLIDKVSAMRTGEDVELNHDEAYLLDRMKMVYISVFGEPLIQDENTEELLYS